MNKESASWTGQWSRRQRDYAETIQRSAKGLLTVINDVLDSSKVEIGEFDVEKAPFSLEVVLRDQKRMLSFATQKKGLEIRNSVELRYKGLLIGDAGRLPQVITNILTNASILRPTATFSWTVSIGAVPALQAPTDTSPSFSLMHTVAEVSEDANSVTVRVDILDSGCGLAPETMSRLFQPFSQADPSTARRFGGTSLGLSSRASPSSARSLELLRSSTTGRFRQSSTSSELQPRRIQTSAFHHKSPLQASLRHT